MVGPETLQMTIWWRVACCMNKATRAQPHAGAHTHTQKYVILIAFPRQH